MNAKEHAETPEAAPGNEAVAGTRFGDKRAVANLAGPRRTRWLGRTIKHQYNDIKGHAKWDAIKWGGGTMITLLIGLVRWWWNSPWRIYMLMSFAGVVGISVLVGWLKYRRVMNNSTQQGSALENGNKTPLTVTMEQHDEGEPKIGKLAGCRVRVRNESKAMAAENVEVRLTSITPVPTHAHPLSFDRSRPLPNEFPVFLKPEVGDGRSINPDSDVQFMLFRQVQHSNVPTIQFFPEKQFGMYSTNEREHTLEIEVSACTCAAIRKKFRIIFSRDLNGIPVFDIKTIRCATTVPSRRPLAGPGRRDGKSSAP